MKKKKSFNVGFFSNTIKAKSFKTAWLKPCLGSTLSALVLMNLVLFQGHKYVRNLNCKFRVLDFCPLWFKRCMTATYIEILCTILSVWLWYVFKELCRMVLLTDLYPFILYSATLDHIPRSQQGRTVSTEKFVFLSS